MEIFYTVLSGTLVYVLGQLVSKFVIDPIHKQKEVIGEITDTLIYYANIFGVHNDENDDANEAMNKFRSLSTKLISKTYLIPFYTFLEKMHIVKSLVKIKNAHTGLVGLSNSVYGGKGFKYEYIDKRYEEIRDSLGI